METSCCYQKAWFPFLSDGSYVCNCGHIRESNEDPPVLHTTRTVEPPVKTTSPSTSLHSTELEHCIPTHSTSEHEAQSPSASEMRTDTYNIYGV